MVLRFKTIRQKVMIPASPADIYDAYVDAKKHSAFIGAGAKSDARIGGSMSAWDGYISGKYLKLEKGKKIVQEWITSEWPEEYPPSILELSFKAVKGGTELVMVHSKVPGEQAADYDSGWVENYWEPLKKYFEKRK